MALCSRKISCISLHNTRSCATKPPLNAFFALLALPLGVFASVDCCHGCQRRMACDCRARRSGVQPLLLAFNGLVVGLRCEVGLLMIAFH
jgi:hypothetical protein